MGPQHKICPRCGQTAVLKMQICGQCGHQYRTQFTAPNAPVLPASDLATRQVKQCRACNRTFNLLTQFQYNVQTGFCSHCLNQKQNAFIQFFSGLLALPAPPTLEQIQQIASYAQQLGFQPDYAYSLVKKESAHLLSRIFVIARSGGYISQETEAYLKTLEREMRLTPADLPAFYAELEYSRKLRDIWSGKPPVVNTSALLASSEVCYWDAPCHYHKVLTSSIKLMAGRLIVSNEKIRFLSSQGGFEFGLGKVSAIQYEPKQGIHLHLTRTQGNGFYAIHDGQILCELLRMLLSQHLRREIYGQEASRHIPQQVKTQVFQRDRGKCVQCGASDYLEFDHIIPFSKGGASTVNNVQVLCRRCNLKKSDQV